MPSALPFQCGLTVQGYITALRFRCFSSPSAHRPCSQPPIRNLAYTGGSADPRGRNGVRCVGAVSGKPWTDLPLEAKGSHFDRNCQDVDESGPTLAHIWPTPVEIWPGSPAFGAGILPDLPRQKWSLKPTRVAQHRKLPHVLNSTWKRSRRAFNQKHVSSFSATAK